MSMTPSLCNGISYCVFLDIKCSSILFIFLIFSKRPFISNSLFNFSSLLSTSFILLWAEEISVYFQILLMIKWNGVVKNTIKGSRRMLNVLIFMLKNWFFGVKSSSFFILFFFKLRSTIVLSRFMFWVTNERALKWIDHSCVRLLYFTWYWWSR